MALMLALAGNAMAQTMAYMVESRTGGKNYSSYSESGLTDAGAKSTAAGCTSGIGSRYGSTYYSVVGLKKATFSAVGNLPATGVYNVYATWGNQSNRKPNIQYKVTHDGGTTAVLIDQSATVNAWVLIGQYTFTAGTGSVEMNNSQANVSGNMNVDAVGWELVSAACDLNVASVDVKGPCLAGDTHVTVTGVNAAATKVYIYTVAGSNYTKIGENTAPGGASTVVVNVDTTVLPSGLVSGSSIRASQFLSDTQRSCQLLAGPTVDDCSQVPAVTVAGSYIPPANTTLSNVMIAGDTKVRVSGVATNATLVKVYANGLAIGSVAPAGATDVDVTVTALASGATIVATQTLPGADQTSLTLEGCLPSTGVVVDACGQIAAVSATGLVSAGQTSVMIKNVLATATLVKVYANDGTTDTLIGTLASPTAGVNFVTVSPALVEGQVLKATQTIRGIEGCMPSSGVTIKAAGLIEDFNSTISVVNSPAPGSYRTWYDVASNAYSSVIANSTAERGMLFGSKCINVVDAGWGNGAYAIFEKVIPATGQYHLEVDMLIDELADQPNPDYYYNFYSTYQVGVAVGSAAVHRETSGALPGLSTAGSYPCLTSGRDGADATAAIKVYTATFDATAGDDLLVALSTDAATLSRSSQAYPSGGSLAEANWPGMKVDNIRLVAGPKPSQCTDVTAPTILPTSASPLEAGGTIVTLAGVDALASVVTVYANGTVIGSMVPGGASQVDVGVTPLVAGQTILATQTKSGLESCNCPGATGPVVGTGDNSEVMISLGIRETGNNCGSVGCDGGVSGNIEWIGASSYSGTTGPVGKALATGVDWQTITFSSSVSGGTDPVTAFPAGTSNGVIDGTYGTLEDISITTKGANTGRYVLYIDEIYNGDTLVTGFESPITAGDLAMFRAPGNSGTTSANLMAYPNIAQVDGSKAAAGTQSYRFEFQFKDNQAKRWVRLTTVDDSTSTDMPMQNPMIDLTKPITMKVMLYGAPACGVVFADRDADGDVDMVDFAMFQRCLTIGGGTYATECTCFDHNFNGTIDENDLTSFNACASGANVPATPGCGD
jgi:hypothetical protein